MSRITSFGEFDGERVERVTLENANGLSAEIISYGARLTGLRLPDRDGRMDDIVLGFDTLEGYLGDGAYFGATCGRYANRIAEGRLSLDGVTYQLDRNEGRTHLHGGAAGFHAKNWRLEDVSAKHVQFTARAEDGEMGYPGACALRCAYELTDDDRLRIVMEAETTKPTVVNMVNHAYFNLSGQGAGDVLNHDLRLASGFYIPVDDKLLATGEILSVAGTPFDFRSSKPIGQDFTAMPGSGGYDHCFCLDGVAPLHPCAEVRDPGSGRRMRLSTSEPGVQFYTGGHMSDRIAGKNGRRLCRFAGFALETQKYPGSPGFAHFPSARLNPGERYHHAMEFHFTTDDG